ncbi:MAG: hypothetical protein E3J72_05015 [Planctomycetota bacterium]|nr:MAG: hypothetical protein E3J72_05015 [Planctomycetota bacterium]
MKLRYRLSGVLLLAFAAAALALTCSKKKDKGLFFAPPGNTGTGGTGIAAKYPGDNGIAGDPDVLLFDDFEAADWYSKWNQSSAPANCTRESSPAFGGSSALRVHVATGEHYGVSFAFKFTDQGLAEPEEIYFRYYVYLASNWKRDGGQVGKFPGISGTYGVAGWGGRPSHGDDGWSARMQNDDEGDTVLVGYYCYHADMTGTYGSSWGWEIDNAGHLDRGKWYCIECYAKMNTITGGSGNNDGVLRGWVDGGLAYEKTDIRFRDMDALKIEQIWFNIYVGGTWTAPQDMDAYFDNAVIARSYIGPRE